MNNTDPNRIIYYKWQPNKKEDEVIEKSSLKDKHLFIKNEVLDTIFQEGNEFVKPITEKRNEHINIANDRLSDRELIKQGGLNPFHHGNYIEDLQMQDQFLKPINSTEY